MNKEKKKLFSITTPCFNSEKTIERTLKSVLAQDCKDYEYIIVDGGSTDGTLDIIRKYESLFEGRMLWKSEPDSGIYEAFNKGIERSKGVYCWNVNADDFMESGALIKLKEFIESSGLEEGVIIGKMRVLSFNGKMLYVSKCSSKSIETIYKKDWMIPHPATLVAKSIYEKYGKYDERFRICGDKDWFHRVYPMNVNFYFVEDILTNFYIGGVSTSNHHLCKVVKDHWAFMLKKYGKGVKAIYKFLIWWMTFLKKSIKQMVLFRD